MTTSNIDLTKLKAEASAAFRQQLEDYLAQFERELKLWVQQNPKKGQNENGLNNH